MPKFADGSPQVTFRKRNGKMFTKTFHSRSTAAKAVVGYRKKGGKIVGTGAFDKNRTFGKGGRSYQMSFSGRARRVKNRY